MIQQLDVAIVSIHTGDQKNPQVQVKSTVVPLVCSPLSNQATNDAKEKYPILSGIDLVDDINMICLDFIVGANYYWSFVSGWTRIFRHEWQNSQIP